MSETKPSEKTNANNNPIVVFIRGLPGSGKSYLANKLIKEFKQGQIVSLDPDLIDNNCDEYLQHSKELAKDGVEPNLFPYRFLRSKAYHGIEQGRIIIWDQPFTNVEIFEKLINRLKDHAKKSNKKISFLMVELSIDSKIATQRIKDRLDGGGHGPSEKTFQKFIKDNKNFNSNEIPSVKIDGTNNIIKSVLIVKNAIKDLRN